MHNEAPASVNFYLSFPTDKGTLNVQWTLRDEDEARLLARFVEFVALAGESGATGGNRAPRNGPPEPDAGLWVPSGVASDTFPEQLPPGAEMASPPPPGELHFDAEKLVGSVEEGKTSWKVRGGKFSKFGIRIWPEVLEAAGKDPEKLNPLNSYSMSGWKAFYELSEDGKPRKVTKLVKV